MGSSIQDKTFTGAVRGELIINNKNWQLLQGKYNDLIAPRNFAAGIINRKEIDEDIKYIDLVVYKIVGQETIPFYKTRGEILMWLKLNFKNVIPDYYYPILNKESWEMYHTQTFEDFKKLGYGLDGLVLTDVDVQYNSQTQGYMYNEEAFKFKSESTDTEIIDMEWTLSRTQRLVPVCIVKPVELSGAVINRCTCNNAKMVQDLGVGIGAKVEITRSNEVIPQLLKVYEESTQKLPKNCPVCGSELVWCGVDLKCNNLKCNNIKLSDLQQWCETVGETDGLQWTLMKQYLDLFKIKSLEDLYDKKDWILMYFNNKQLSITEQKVKTFFNKLYIDDIQITKALAGLNIPRLGTKTAELLSSEEELIHKLLLYSLYPNEDNKVDLFNKCFEVVKSATTQSIFDNIDKFKTLRYTYYNDMDTENRLIYPKNNYNNIIKYVAVTGSLYTMKRKDFETYIKQYGYELSSNLKKCEYLITNNPNSGSTKNKQAQEYNVKIITEKNFLELLK